MFKDSVSMRLYINLREHHILDEFDILLTSAQCSHTFLSKGLTVLILIHLNMQEFQVLQFHE